MRRIAAKYIYALDASASGNGANKPIRDGFVEVDDNGFVTAVGKADRTETERFDGAIIPGFVNSHCHVELSHLKGIFTKGSGMAGFIDQINSLRDSVPAEQKKVLLKAEMDKMWAAGVSAMADISNCDDSFATKIASPMYTRSFLEVFGTEPEDCADVIASAKSLKQEADTMGLDASITPHSCYTMSPQLVTAASAEGLSTGYLSYHSQESQQEEDMIMYGRGEMYDNRCRDGMSIPPATGTSSLEYFLDRLEQVHPAPFEEHILLVHNVCLTEAPARRALGMLKNVYWVVCPLSNIFIHNALPPIALMRSLGLNICVGTDSLSSNDDLDMVGEIFCLQENFPDVSLGEILGWACLNGARFLSKEAELGSIAVGKRPGIVGISAVDDSGRLTSESHSTRLV